MSSMYKLDLTTTDNPEEAFCVKIHSGIFADFIAQVVHYSAMGFTFSEENTHYPVGRLGHYTVTLINNKVIIEAAAEAAEKESQEFVEESIAEIVPESEEEVKDAPVSQDKPRVRGRSRRKGS